MEIVIKQRQKQLEYQKEKLHHELQSEDDKLMTEERITIVSLAPLLLLQKLKDGTLSAVQVLKAFQAKSLEVTEKLNCVTEFIAEAEEWAEKLDELSPADRGPLHGLPVSIKESINVKGCDTTLGLAKHVHCPLASHSAIVEVLLKKGAVPFCKTNLPQTMLSFTCSNPVFGTTVHPLDVTRTPGGSTGGEGALIAAGGSVLGIGSDLAGSCRVPAGFCGCVGIKPTLNRLSGKGIKKALAGMVGNVSVPGVMGRDVAIVTKCLEALLCENDLVDLDVEVVPLSWDGEKVQEEKPLTIGWYDSFDFLPATPGIRRAVHEARDALIEQGHKLIPFTPPDADWVIGAVFKVLTADDGLSMKNHVDGEIVDPYLMPAIKSFAYGKRKKQYIRYRLRNLSKTMHHIVQTDIEKCSDLWNQLILRQNYIQKFSKMFKESGLDLMLGPTYPIPAPQHDVPIRIGPACIYSCLYNYCDFPAISVPVSNETEDDQKNLEKYPENDLLFKILKKASKGGVGLPLSAQLIALPWQEELVCRAARQLELALVNKKRIIKGLHTC